MLAAVCWNVWKARNGFVFRAEVINPRDLDAAIAKDCSVWRLCTFSLADPPPGYHSTANHPNPYPPPSTPNWVVHCDGSFVNDSQEAAFGVVLSNNQGQVMSGVNGTFFCSSAIVAEVRAIYEATIMASTMGAPTTILSDCKVLVDAINDPKHQWTWECYALMGACLCLLQRKTWINVRFVRRNLNKVADWVAVGSRQHNLPHNWISFLNSIGSPL
ncbi:hypothetical protein LINPERHAP1_LOCUS1960 [Linum perenne]